MRQIPAHDVTAAALSRDIYLDRVPFERACVRAGLMSGEWYDHRGTQAALVRSAVGAAAPASWLVFRGTEAGRVRLLDIVANLKVIPRPWSGEGWVHGGYCDALERVRYGARRLAEEVSSTIPLYVTGHSLGGALATLYAAWVSADNRDRHRIAALVTFGAPRCGSPAALDPIRRNTAVRRYTMPGDPAPLWPLIYAHPAPGRRLAPLEEWQGPVTRHSIDGYATACAIA